MKAIVYTEYGAPDVLRLQEIEKPTPTGDQVLIKVHAAAANPADWHLMRGEPFLARLDNGLQRPRNTQMGADVAGRVEAVGSAVTQFKPGDQVYGDLSGAGFSTFAEYVCGKESLLALKPANLTFEQAAAIPLAGVTALQGLRKGQIQAGQKVLVNGASGGVGMFAVQIAKAYGAQVTGVCSTRNLDLVRSFGAERVIDYTQQDFTRQGTQYDLIFDSVGNLSVPDLQRALTPRGQGVVVGFTTLARLFGVALRGMLASRNGGQKIGLLGTAQANQADLLTLKELAEAGKLTPHIDKRYPLHETAEAIRHLETGRARGKVVISVVEG
jgi:NADPH:quinone reductase-like Zn-dependent oxidoreductase